MTDLPDPFSRAVVIVNDLGLHARAAAAVAKMACSAKAKVWISREGESVDASDIMDILTLACEKGTTITIRVEDPEDQDVMNNLAALIENGFGE
ncbi:MAG: HPr family phosphocarrier protein [Thermodesulfobacteriota bacterium]